MKRNHPEYSLDSRSFSKCPVRILTKFCQQTFLKDLRVVMTFGISKVSHPCRKRNILPNCTIVNGCAVFKGIDTDKSQDGSGSIFKLVLSSRFGNGFIIILCTYEPDAADFANRQGLSKECRSVRRRGRRTESRQMNSLFITLSVNCFGFPAKAWYYFNSIICGIGWKAIRRKIWIEKYWKVSGIAITAVRRGFAEVSISVRTADTPGMPTFSFICRRMRTRRRIRTRSRTGSVSSAVR